MKDFDAPTISPGTLNAVAGCNPVTFRAWRRRNGLLQNRHSLKDAGDRRAHKFALIDVVLVRCMVEMVEHGFAAEDAVEIVNDPMFEVQLRLIMSGETVSTVLGALRERQGDRLLRMIYANPSDAVAYLLGKSEGGGAITIVDLRRIVDHVVAAIDSGAELEDPDLRSSAADSRAA